MDPIGFLDLSLSFCSFPFCSFLKKMLNAVYLRTLSPVAYFWFFVKFGGNLTSRWYLHSPPSGRRMLNTIDYQIIIFLINFTTKFEAELFYFSFILHLTLIMGYLLINSSIIQCKIPLQMCARCFYLTHICNFFL